MTGFRKPASSASASGACRHALRVVALLLFLGVLVGVAAGETAHGTPPESGSRQDQHANARQPWVGSGAITVAAVGDGADSGSNDTKVVDMIIAQQPDLFLYLGDVYDKGTAQEFADNYHPSYGRLRAITNPVAGNHEYQTSGATGYFGYWDNIPSYYSYNSGGWHFVALNSALSESQLAPGSAQYEWLKNDLDANSLPCTLVYYHHPRYSAGGYSGIPKVSAIWSLLAQKGVDVVLNGHDHSYERWKPLDGSGNPAANGVTEFVAGTGGHGVSGQSSNDSRLAFYAAVYGALFLDLAADRLNYRFLNTAGQTLDSGTVTCSGAAAGTPTRTHTPAPGPTSTRTPTPGAPAAQTFPVAADAYVSADNPSTNYGASSALRVDGSPVVRSYLRFNVQGLGGPVSRATLRIFATSGSSTGWQARAAAGGWSEAGITFNNAPAPGGSGGTSGGFGAGSWTQADVTALVAGNGEVNLALTGSSSTAIAFSSRSGANPPQLVVETGGGAAAADAVGDAGAASVSEGPDSDGDGLNDADEALNYTDAQAPDTDGDGLGDLWEVESGLNPADASGANGALGDPDGDGASNAAEQAAGTDPLNADLTNHVWLPIVSN